MSFKKINKPFSVNIPSPDNSMTFFEEFKRISELYWETITLKKGVYGYQIQPGSKWKEGLSDNDLLKFESAVGFSFPEPLKNFYKVMNGLDRPGVDISDCIPAFESQFYSFPGDLELIAEMINWIYTENSISNDEILKSGISRILPVFAHRFMMIDIPENRVLSMLGKDIIYWSDNISKLLIKDVFGDILSAKDDKKLMKSQPEVSFWLDRT